jgi:hypothetical protein
MTAGPDHELRWMTLLTLPPHERNSRGVPGVSSDRYIPVPVWSSRVPDNLGVVSASDTSAADSADRDIVIDLTEDEASPLLSHIAVAQVAAIERDDPWDDDVFRVRRTPAGHR